MEILWLLVCGAVAWVVAIVVNWLPSLGQLFMPPQWVVLGLGLGIVAWLLHGD